MATTDALLSQYFIIPLSDRSYHEPIHGNQLVLLSDRLCDLLLQLLDASSFDGPVEFLKSAPLLVDLDIERGLHARLNLLHQSGGDKGNPRLNFLMDSLEQTGLLLEV